MDNTIPVMPATQTTQVNTNTTPRTSFFSRMFTGRLSRSAYIIGILFVLVSVAVLAALLFALLSLFFDSTNLTVFLLGIVFVVTLFFAFSLSLRRLHDLNRSGWFLLLFLPGEVGTFFFIIVNYASSVDVNVLNFLHAIPPYVDIAFTVIRWIANVFTIYMVLWTGDEEENNYGLPVGKLNIKQILGFSDPIYKTPTPVAEETTEPAY